MGEFRMPSLGADMDVGTIIEWLVQPGDPVTRGQIVAVVDTAKAAIEIEAFETGVLERILVTPGTQVPVGTPLALIGAGIGADTTVPVGPPTTLPRGAGTGAEPSVPVGPRTTLPIGAGGAEPTVPAGPPTTLPIGASGAEPTMPAGPPTTLPIGAGGAEPTVPEPTGISEAPVEAEVSAGSAAQQSVTGAGTAAATAGRRSTLVPMPPGTGTAVAAGRGPSPARVTPAAVPRVAGPPRATPPVRHLAHQLGVDLDAVSGSGSAGQITHQDVLRAASPEASPASAPVPWEAPLAPAPAPSEPPSARAPVPWEPPSAPAHAPEPPTGPAHASSRPPALPPASPPQSMPSPRSPTALGSGGARLRATPQARRIAAQRGVDLDSVVGTGREGAILAADVQRAAVRRPRPVEHPARPSAALPSPADTLSGQGAVTAQPRAPAVTGGHPERKAAMRSAIASLMSRSNAEIPHYYVTQTIDLDRALTWLHAHNATLPPDRRLLPAVLFLRATVLAALAVPDLNGHWVSGELRPADRVDLGVAIATRGGGLVTPAIADAAGLEVDALMARLADLVRRARRGTLKRAELAGASITVSSLGESGPDALYGVIFPPQVALVGVGGIVERPWAVDGMLTVRPTATVILAADHRASDGRTASAFLTAFAHALDHPEEL